jgi:hypothetical protein
MPRETVRDGHRWDLLGQRSSSQLNVIFLPLNVRKLIATDPFRHLSVRPGICSYRPAPMHLPLPQSGSLTLACIRKLSNPLCIHQLLYRSTPERKYFSVTRFDWSGKLLSITLNPTVSASCVGYMTFEIGHHVGLVRATCDAVR